MSDSDLLVGSVSPLEKRMKNTLRKKRMKLIGGESDKPPMLQRYLFGKLQQDSSKLAALGIEDSLLENSFNQQGSTRPNNNERRNRYKKRRRRPVSDENRRYENSERRRRPMNVHKKEPKIEELGNQFAINF